MDKEEFDKLVKVLYEHMKGDERLKKALERADDAGIAHCQDMGAILTDAILQRAMKYSIVEDEVQKVKDWGCKTMTEVNANAEKFEKFLSETGRFRGSYPKTFAGILKILLREGKNTAEEIGEWLANSANRDALRDEVHGVGTKTANYLYQLCGGDNVCVDTHIRKYINHATGAQFEDNDEDNHQAERIFTEAACKWGKSPRKLDSAIWKMGSNSDDN